MTDLDRALVRRKMLRITTNLDLLRAFVGLTLEEYRSDPIRQKAIERLLQEMVEAAIDVNLHILGAVREPGPIDNRSSFLALARHGIISSSLADDLAPAAGLRNRLVHEYDMIDDVLVLESVGSALELFPRYTAAIEHALASDAL